jgi:hypothetical protein|tara:strand:+ start:71 stop:238 length:168 start_codon:yes stop_codon:yes gene_type:complete
MIDSIKNCLSNAHLDSVIMFGRLNFLAGLIYLITFCDKLASQGCTKTLEVLDVKH